MSKLTRVLAVIFDTQAPLPASAAQNRGRFQFVAGDAGVADTLSIGAKNAADTYAWMDLTRNVQSPNGTPTVALTGAAGTPSLLAGTTDEVGVLSFVTTAAGLAAGTVVAFTFSAARPNANYVPVLQPMSLAARALTGSVGPTSRTTTGWTLFTPDALAASTTYQWGYHVRG